jgi:cyclophilin family peptidyl-prolyl cis-trans isomerase
MRATAFLDLPLRNLWRRASGLGLAGLVAACGWTWPAQAQGPTADGLYAECVTSLGTYWCRLEFEKAPRTVANFVLLAEGQRDWVDRQRARLSREPLYRGLKFHRVITGFMNQCGSPDGLGDGGPGYQFRDEFHPQLRHNKPGILSMANSGTNSNGSQFFVTVEPTPWLDDKHTVFGEVVQGYDVVEAINTTAGTASGTPKVTVTLERVQIVRQGAAATAFDPAQIQPPLPPVGPVETQIGFDASGKLWVNYPVTEKWLYHVFYGADLAQWASATFEGGPLDVSALLGQARVFFFVLAGGGE